VRQEDADHIINAIIKADYICAVDNELTKYIGLTMEWDAYKTRRPTFTCQTTSEKQRYV
jgi:hypothetical protein